MAESQTPSTRTSSAIAAGGARILRSRRLMRAPIYLYKARLGFLFGSRMLMLEHTGRVSGERRYVVLEVVDRPTPDTYIVVSGFGTKAQWFRNVQADAHVRISTGRHVSAPAVARTLGQEEADATLARYAEKHAKAWERFTPVLESTLGAAVETRNTKLPMVELTLNHDDS